MAYEASRLAEMARMAILTINRENELIQKKNEEIERVGYLTHERFKFYENSIRDINVAFSDVTGGYFPRQFLNAAESGDIPGFGLAVHPEVLGGGDFHAVIIPASESALEKETAALLPVRGGRELATPMMRYGFPALGRMLDPCAFSHGLALV